MKSKEEIEQLAADIIKTRFNETDGYHKVVYVEAYIKGYTQCQEDMNDNAIRFADWINKNDYEKIHYNRWCKKFMSYTHSTVELYQIYIESL